MSVLVASLKELLSSVDCIIQRMGKEDPPLEPETILGPTIKEEYVVSSNI
jgi:hypothetical protein